MKEKILENKLRASDQHEGKNTAVELVQVGVCLPLGEHNRVTEFLCKIFVTV